MVNPYSINIADFSEGMKGLEQGFERRGQLELAKAKKTANIKMREGVANLIDNGTDAEIETFLAKNPGADKVFDELIDTPNRLKKSREVGEAVETIERSQEEIDKRRETFNLMKKGTPQEIEAFTLENPDSESVIDELVGITNENTKEDKVKTALDILTGADPVKALSDHAMYIDSEGGDASSTIEYAKQAAGNPEEAIQGALRTLAFYDPKKLDSLRDIHPEYFKDEDTPDIREFKFAQKEKDFAEWKAKKAIKGGKGKKQKTASFLVKDKKTGALSIATGSFNTETGKLETETAPLGDLKVVSKLGETPKEKTVREVTQKETEAVKKARVARDDALIVRGVTAAESTATTRRALELLDLVNTGGFSKANYETRRAFGIESANEGELSNSLGKTVLSQLKETFGAAFTENEGNRLAKIEASIGKSPAANKRLLIQALRITTKTAERAKQAALRRGDEETASDIDDLLKFSLSDPENPFQNIDTNNFKSLKPGTILETPYGDAEWDGTNLKKVGE